METLDASILENLPRYRSGDFDNILGNPENYFEHETKEVDYAAFVDLRLRVKNDRFDAINSMLVYRIMSEITPSEARDSRLWSYLAHAVALPYTRSRWPIPNDDKVAVKHVRDHFFPTDLRSFERSHSLGRLWWNAHICSRAGDKVDLERALGLLLDENRSDIRSNLVERPTTVINDRLFAVIVAKLDETEGTEKAFSDRDRFRDFMEEINAIGGYMLLDCLSDDELYEIATETVENVVARASQNEPSNGAISTRA